MNDARLKLTMTGAIADDKRWSELVSKAHQVFLDALGPSAVPVREDWSLGRDTQDRPILRVGLSDFSGQVQTEFAPDELENARRMLYRLLWLWGDLLQDRSHKLFKKLVETDSSVVGGNGT